MTSRSRGFDSRRAASVRSDGGQASLETVAAVPAILLVGLICFQLLAAGYSAMMVDGAATAAALAAANGADPRGAAERAVPGLSRDRISTRREGDKVVVTIRPPALTASIARRLQVEAAVHVLTGVEMGGVRRAMSVSGVG